MAEPVRGAGQPQWPLTPQNIQVTYGNGGSSGIVRGTGADWFGPLNPLKPIAPPDVAGRRFDFPVGYNLVVRPRAYEPIGFPELRGFADAYDLLRLVIETRKDQMESERWAIRPIDTKFQRKSAKVAPEMQSRIDAITTFFKKPDLVTPWKTWLRGLLEDMFVIDAATLYCQRTRGGKLYALPQLDGATIKRVIDDWGRTPQPYRDANGQMIYPPAYQQVLKGFPAVDYATRDIIYRPRNVRPHKIYGYSPVQQILMTVNIALRRQMWQLDYYSEGSIPDALIGVPNDWTPDQVKQFQEYWDTEFAGDLAKRRRAKFVPGDTAAKVHQTKEPEQKNDFDEWLARLVCFAFSIPPTWAVKMMNRASGEKQSEQSEEEGLEPTKDWVKELIDGIIADEFASSDLELAWIEGADLDPAKNETTLEGRLKVAGITLNEFRDSLGLDPSDNPAADQLMVLTPTGYVPIEANTIEGKQANLDAFGPPPPSPFAPGAQGGAGGKSGEENAGGDDNGDAGSQNDAGEKLNGRIGFGKRNARGRRLAQVPFDRPKTRTAIKAVRSILAKAFDRLQAEVASHLGAALDKAKSKSRSKAKSLVDDLDLAMLIGATDDIADALASAAMDSGQQALAQLGVDDRSALVDQVNDAAVAYAKERAAELVGMRYTDDGDLIENPDAEWAITVTTRDTLRDIIANGLEENVGLDQILADIEASGLFSDTRAAMIARTEIARANSQAALAGYRTARDGAGVKVKKAWILGPNPCPICEDNADDGDIDLDDDFSSGDDAPPAHPNCECALVPSVEE